MLYVYYQSLLFTLLNRPDSICIIDILLFQLKDINSSHLQDVAEERSIIKLCGYPLCSQELKHIPIQQFHISTKSNKVYDIQERKVTERFFVSSGANFSLQEFLDRLISCFYRTFAVTNASNLIIM